MRLSLLLGLSGLLLLCASCSQVGTARSAPLTVAPGVSAKVAPAALAEVGATLTLSPNGNDAWSGAAKTNAAGTDGPLRTLAGAQKKWRQLPLPPDKGIEVVLRGGNYPLQSTFQLSPQDPPVLFKAFPGEKPRLVGASAATNWRQGQWKGQRAFITAWDGDEALQALYVNGGRAQRARWPKTGTLKIKDPKSNGKSGWGQAETDRFAVDPADWKKMGDASGAEVVALHFWIESRLPVQSFEPATGDIVATRRTVAPLDWGYKGVPAPYYVENARGALREAGEWIHDIPNHQLIYLPRPNETLANTSLNAPRLGQLVRVDGDETAKVSDVRFEGIGFCESAATLPSINPDPRYKPFAGSGQAAVDVAGAIEVSRAQNITFSNCDFSALGWYGLQLGDGSEAITLERCRFSDLGAGGVSANGSDANGPLPLRTRALQIRDCTFQKGGRVWPSCVALLLRHVSDCVVSHNSISDFFYTGISCGWTWGYGPSVAKNNVISNNHIWNIGQNVLSDMGGVYLLGSAPGTRVEGNWIHDVQSATYGGWGIYLDEGSSEVEVRNNIVARCTSNAFNLHYGKSNRVENNIFVGGNDAVVARNRVEEHPMLALSRNIFVSDGAPIYSSELPGAAKTIESNNNLVWSLKGTVKATQKDSWGTWQEAARDQNSRVANPRFADIARDNYDLPSNSPAFQLGFQKWDWRDVGPR